MTNEEYRAKECIKFDTYDCNILEDFTDIDKWSSLYSVDNKLYPLCVINCVIKNRLSDDFLLYNLENPIKNVYSKYTLKGNYDHFRDNRLNNSIVHSSTYKDEFIINDNLSVFIKKGMIVDSNNNVLLSLCTNNNKMLSYSRNLLYNIKLCDYTLIINSTFMLFLLYNFVN